MECDFEEVLRTSRITCGQNTENILLPVDYYNQHSNIFLCRNLQSGGSSGLIMGNLDWHIFINLFLGDTLVGILLPHSVYGLILT